MRRLTCCTLALVAAVSCNESNEAATRPAHEPAGQPVQPAPAPIDPEHTLVFAAGPLRVSLAELARVMGPPPQQRLRISEHERRVAFLDEYQRNQLLAFAAEERGYFSDKAVLAMRRSLLVQRLLDELFGQHGSQIVAVTDADVKAYYDAHPERWTSPEQVRARHILLHDADKARRVLEEITAHPTDPALFAKLAHEDSLDARTRERGGDLGRFALQVPAPPGPDAVTVASLVPPVVPESVRRAAFALTRVGDLVPAPVKSELGYHVVQYLGRQPTHHTELQQVAYMIGNQLREERQAAAIEAFTKTLVEQAHVQVNTAALAHVKVRP